MEVKHTYICNFCSYRSESAEETEAHEASHIGNGLTLSEYRYYKGLIESVRRKSAQVYLSNNGITREELDNSLEKLINFEKEHGIDAL